MNRVARGLAFVFLFCADVQVHAAAVLAEQKMQVELPSGGKLILKKNSLINKGNESVGADETIQLVRGEFYAEVSSATIFKTPFAVFRCSGDCRMLIFRSSDQVAIKNLLGSVIVRRTGDKQDYLLPVATQLAVSAVTSKGWAEMEFPQSLPWNDTAREWGSLFPGDVKAFKNALEEFREVWKTAVEATSRLHAERAGREIASAKRAAEQAAAQAAWQEKEDAELRKLFRLKNDY